MRPTHGRTVSKLILSTVARQERAYAHSARMLPLRGMPQARSQLHHAAPSDALAGTVERVTFHNADNGFCVLKVQARGKRDQVTVVGHAPVVGAGEWITASGAWISDRVHGLQFKAEVLTATAPTG